MAATEEEEVTEKAELRVVPSKHMRMLEIWADIALIIVIFFLLWSPEWFTDFLDRISLFIFGR